MLDIESESLTKREGVEAHLKEGCKWNQDIGKSLNLVHGFLFLGNILNFKIPYF